MEQGTDPRNNLLVPRRTFLLSASAIAATGILAACSSGTPSGAVGSSNAAGTASGEPGSGTSSGASSAPSSAGGSPAAPGAAAGTFNFAEAGAFTTLNPWARTVVSEDVSNQIFSRLMYLDSQAKPVPDLAESWTASPDNKSVTLTIRSGATWHDGKPVTAKDFETLFSYFSAKDLAQTDAVIILSGLFKVVSTVTASDDTTLVVEFTKPVPYYETLFSYWYLIRMDDPNDASFLKALPVGTGPFKMTKFDEQTGATLETYDGYFGSKAGFSTIQFNTLNNPSSIAPGLRAGTFGGALVQNYADLDALNKTGNFEKMSALQGVWNVMVNCKNGPLADVRVRQALSYAMDRKQMVEAGFFGLEQPVSTPFFSPTSLGYSADLVNAQAFDLDKATQLLKDAGASSLKVTLQYPTSYSFLEAMVQVWQAGLEQIGVTMTLRPLGNAQWTVDELVKPDTQLMMWNNARCLLDPAIFWSTQVNFFSGHEYAIGYEDPDQAALVSKGADSTDEAVRKEAYVALNKSVVESAHAISVSTYSNTWLWHKEVTGGAYDIVANLLMGGLKQS